MNDKDKEAFDKWCVEKFSIAPELIEDFRFSFTHKLIHTESAWQAACKYMRLKYLDEDTKKAIEMANASLWIANLQNENKKLREALEKIIDQYFDLPYELRMKKGLKEGRDSLIAREALKEVGEK